MKVYIAGNITGCDAIDTVWKFSNIEHKLRKLGFTPISPIRGKKLGYNKDTCYKPNEIVHRDLHDIQKCDIMLASMDKIGIGTSMEIFYARSLGKPVVLIASKYSIINHYWIRTFVSKVVPTLDEALLYLKEWYRE